MGYVTSFLPPKPFISNDPLGESPAEMSVGGWKMSGLGVENGRRGLSAWVREKSTLVEGGGIVGTVFSKL